MLAITYTLPGLRYVTPALTTAKEGRRLRHEISGTEILMCESPPWATRQLCGIHLSIGVRKQAWQY